MKDKILDFQFEPVSAKGTDPSYNDGSNQDEAETQHDRLSSQEWCNCKNCENMPTSLNCVCCHEIAKVERKTLLEYSCSGISCKTCRK